MTATVEANTGDHHADDVPDLPSTLRQGPKISFRAWLWLQLQTETKFEPLAKFVLSGGPDGMWPASLYLKPADICNDITDLYAGSHPHVSIDFVTLAQKAEHEYYSDNGLSVSALVEKRQERERRRRRIRSSGVVRKAIERAESNVTRDVADDITLVAYRDGKLAHGEGGLPLTICDNVSNKGRRCKRYAVLGHVRCDLHGGIYLDPEEQRELIRRSSERLLAASDAAIDTLLDLMDNSLMDGVRAKAAELILDRAGFRAGLDLSIVTQKTDQSSPVEQILEKLANLAKHNAEAEPKQLEQLDDQNQLQLPIDIPGENVVEGEIVEDHPVSAAR